MIRFLVEDKSDSPFVKLFNLAYGDTADVLYCSATNTKLKRMARKLAQGGNTVIVYMDMVPDNKDLFTLYSKLFELYSDEGLDVIIMPIVCAEYQFIRSVVGLNGPIFSTVGLKEILTKSPDYKSSPLVQGHSADRYKTFEKFCKLFCDCSLSRGCCSVDAKSSGRSVSKPYFSANCYDRTHDCCKICNTSLSLFEKAQRYVAQYPVIPYIGSTLNNGSVLSMNGIIQVSRRLVNEYNQMACAFGFPHRQIKQR